MRNDLQSGLPMSGRHPFYYLQGLIYFQELRKSQWLDMSAQEETRNAKLRAVVSHAYENIRYYNDIFNAANLRPADIKTLQDLEKIPITTRAQLQSQPPENLVDKNVSLSKCMRLTTSGSSGMPLNVYRTSSESFLKDMAWARTSIENGRKLTDKTVYFKYHMPPKFWFERLGIWKKHVISLTETPEKQIVSLLEIKPNIIRSNPFDITLLSRKIQKEKIPGIRPRLIFTMGSLLEDHDRACITSVLGAGVRDFYGSTELGCIAWQCPEQQGYHINIDTLILEIVKNGKAVNPGILGKVVCTGLEPSVMPFIRYDLGDMATFSSRKCSCGRELPLLEKLDGRADEFFVSLDGSLRSPSTICNNIKQISGVEHFRLTQRKPDKFEAIIVPNTNYTASCEKKVVETLTRIMGHEIDVRFETVREMPKDPSGKIRSLISHVKGRW